MHVPARAATSTTATPSFSVRPRGSVVAISPHCNGRALIFTLIRVRRQTVVLVPRGRAQRPDRRDVAAAEDPDAAAPRCRRRAGREQTGGDHATVAVAQI